jgi:hypothetical protein
VEIVKFSHQIFNKRSTNFTECFDFSGQSPLITYLCFCLTFSLGWRSDLSVDVSQAATAVLPSSMTIISGDCPKLQHLAWFKEGIHHLESALGDQNQRVKKIIIKLGYTKVSVACLIII